MNSDAGTDAESDAETVAEQPTEADAESPTVNARTVSEERTVFTEDGNPDGWISTDCTVTLRE